MSRDATLIAREHAILALLIGGSRTTWDLARTLGLTQSQVYNRLCFLVNHDLVISLGMKRARRWIRAEIPDTPNPVVRLDAEITDAEDTIRRWSEYLRLLRHMRAAAAVTKAPP